ncbi:hypothetical protein [Staphylococcus shinii]|uniref:hypothetical protein n=2 Tax=Staphylococcus TaxID=1279 RepID=UPI0035173177
MNEKKWYLSNWFVILMLIFIFPVGLFLMWYNKKWTKPVRWIVTGFIALAIVISPFMEDEKSQSEEKNVTQKDKSEKTEKDKPKEKIKKEEPKKKESKKKLTDEQKINKALKKEVRAADIDEVIFESDSLGTQAIIELKGKENLSDKMTTRGFKMGISETLYALKTTGIDFDSVDVYVNYPLTDGIEEKDHKVITAKFDGSTVKKMNEDAVQSLPDHLEQHAESYFQHKAVKE